MRELAEEPDDLPHPELSEADRDRLGAYVAHFNARDFDAIRAMIADDVRLDLVNKTRMNGKAEVSRYFGNYSQMPPTGTWCRDWWKAARRSWCSIPTSRARRRNISCCCNGRPTRSPTIRDFRHAPYVIDGAEYLDLIALPGPAEASVCGMERPVSPPTSRAARLKS